MGRGDPLIGDALQTILERGDFLPSLPDAGPGGPPVGGAPAQIDTDPAIVAGLIERNQASIAALKRDIQTKSGPALFDFLLEAFEEHKRVLGDPLSHRPIMAGMQATWWLNEQLEAWVGEKNAADTLTLSAPGNVTSEMGLALLDVADMIRPHPHVVAFLQHVADGGCEDEAFLDELAKLAGGREAQEAIRAYLEKYGMRCVGEIDITRPRWSERPTTLVPLILDNIRNFTPGEAKRRLEQGRQAAWSKEQELGLVIEPSALAAARRSLEEPGFLLLGEVHGVRENPLVIRALMRAFGLSGLALECVRGSCRFLLRTMLTVSASHRYCCDRQRLPCSWEADAAVDAAKLTDHHHLPGWHPKGVRGRQA